MDFVDHVQTSATPSITPSVAATPEPDHRNGAQAAATDAKLERSTNDEPANDDPSKALAQADDDVVLEDFELPPDDPLYEQFRSVIGKFNQQDKNEVEEPDKPEVYYDDDNDDIPDEEEETGVTKMSKKARKAMNKLSIAELKAIVKKPDLVEWTDTSAPDPRLLLSIKSHRNVVPVPSHWSLKREYLSSKRGVEKPAFALPKFIQETGIAEMRDAVLEKQAEASLKQKQRERVQPKMGRLDIDYQKLYEAFFRHQTKPELTRYGEVYYEGKEYETNLRHLRPGELSDELKEALNMPPGAPPPWLIHQQRFGPPPSYPALKIPGLNAPPPPGAQWGFHPGGYGKPPVDEQNRPLFGGDVFGVAQPAQDAPSGAPVEKTLWGELQPPEEEEEEEEEEDEDEEEDEEGKEEDVSGGLETPSGTFTPSGMASAVPTEYGGTQSVAGEFTLRKEKRGTETEEPSGPPRAAYQVLREQAAPTSGFFGSERTYDIKGAQQAPLLGQETRKRKVGDVDVSVDLDQLERDDRLTKEEMQRQFESQRREGQGGQWSGMVDQEDLSQMIAEESRKRLKKDQEAHEARRSGRR